MTSYFNACDVTVANSNQTFFYIVVFWRALVPPYFEKGSATHALGPIELWKNLLFLDFHYPKVQVNMSFHSSKYFNK